MNICLTHHKEAPMETPTRLFDFATKCSNQSAQILFLKEVNRIVNHGPGDAYPERKRAHTATHAGAYRKNGVKHFYRRLIHYAPEFGYWGCCKDLHGTMIVKPTECYCLASTVREVIAEEIYKLSGGEE